VALAVTYAALRSMQENGSYVKISDIFKEARSTL
jgi:hypothetical protein